jgi:hypothetical protein
MFSPSSDSNAFLNPTNNCKELYHLAEFHGLRGQSIVLEKEIKAFPANKIANGHKGYQIMALDTGRAASTVTIDDLERELGERIITPSHASYERSRAVWNGLIDRRPALIVHAASSADARLAVNYARETGMALAIRGQGHDVGGHGVCDRGVVIDMSAMKRIDIDINKQSARVGSGITVGEFFDAVEAKGFITTVGSHSTVGLAGLTLGGGIGLLMSKYGLVSDNLLEAEIVTADGELRTANDDENTDIFWAIRGGGGNFGVVTSLTYRIYPADPTVAGMIVHPLPKVRQVLGHYRTYAENAPDNLGIFAAIVTGPSGHPSANLMVCHTGPLEDGDKLLAPIREFGPPVADLVRPMPYGALLHILDSRDPVGDHYTYTMRGIEKLTDELLDIISHYSMQVTSPGTAVVLYRQHGAVTAKSDDSTAYSARRLPYLLGIYTGWPNDGDGTVHQNWFNDFVEALKPFTVAPCFVSLLDETCIDDVRENYGPNFDRLQQIKTKWDPTNLFRHNHNIPPLTDLD